MNEINQKEQTIVMYKNVNCLLGVIEDIHTKQGGEVKFKFHYGVLNNNLFLRIKNTAPNDNERFITDEIAKRLGIDRLVVLCWCLMNYIDPEDLTEESDHEVLLEIKNNKITLNLTRSNGYKSFLDDLRAHFNRDLRLLN